MGNENTIFLIGKLLYLIGLHKIQCKSSYIVTQLHIHTFREGLRDELTRVQMLLSKAAFISASDIHSISVELEDRFNE